MSKLLFLAVLLASPGGESVTGVQRRGDVDVIELNHFYDGDGDLVFTQLIFWRWFPGTSEYHVEGYKIVRTPHQPHSGIRLLTRPPRVVWADSRQTFEIRARSFRESWTQHDPEVEDRADFPQSGRNLFRKTCVACRSR